MNMIKLAIAGLCLTSTILAPAVHAQQYETLNGVVRVIDGDTLQMGRQRIRLHGIDAPESSQPCSRDGRVWMCGREATSQLDKLIGRRPVSCATMDRDRWGRAVAICNVGDININAWLVSAGWALDYRRYSGGAYEVEQAAAQNARRGVWAGTLTPPWEWRRAN